jgi:4-hydroxyacetophenone monooxygenase
MPKDDIATEWMRPELPLQDTAELRQALAEVSLPTLLMVYVHLSRDAAMLDRFAPFIHPAMSGQPTVIPEADAAALRASLLEALTVPGAASDAPLPHALMQKMMTVCVGEPVEDEFVPLLLDQMGLELPRPRRENPERPMPPADFRVLVIGAGLSGIAAGIKLGEAGYSYVIIEKNPDVGGTWFENRYPGVGVDTPSHFYSYSFEINPDWSTYYPKGREMLTYFRRVADNYGLRDNIRFETRVLSCVFDEAAGLWNVRVRSKDGDETVLQANAVINCHGPVNRWSWPDVPGFAEFEGPKMHTAGWDHDVPLAGRSVAVIGTGASSAQLVPAIAAEAGQVTVFMRSKHWVINNPEIGNVVTDGKRWALRHIPHYREWFRFRVYWGAGDGLYPNVVKDRGWNEELSVSPRNEAARQWALSYMHQKFADRPDLIEKLTPNFPIFSKRIILDPGWFDSLLRDNVTLEDDPIARVLPHAIRTKSGREYPVDVIACATGFDVAKMLGSLEVIGRDGRSLGAEWGDEDPRAYLGVTIPGYPNFFMTVGPNSAPNHAAGQNLISETQVNFIVECLDLIVASNKKTIDTKVQAYEDWNRKVEDRMPEMIWTHPKANSYYNNSKGRVYLSFPFRLVDYWSWTRKPDPEHFVLQ